MTSTALNGVNGMEASSNTQVLWGTNINTNEIQLKMKSFINTFVDIKEDSDDFTQAPYYINQLKNIKETEQYILDIDCEHVYQFDPSLYRQIEYYPADVIPIFDLVVSQVYKELFLYNFHGHQAENHVMGQGSHMGPDG